MTLVVQLMGAAILTAGLFLAGKTMARTRPARLAIPQTLLYLSGAGFGAFLTMPAPMQQRFDLLATILVAVAALCSVWMAVQARRASHK